MLQSYMNEPVHYDQPQFSFRISKLQNNTKSSLKQRLLNFKLNELNIVIRLLNKTDMVCRGMSQGGAFSFNRKPYQGKSKLAGVEKKVIL